MNIILLSQIIGLLAIILNVSSLQFKKKTSMMKMLLITNILFLIQYFLLKAYSASLICLITIIRTILFTRYDEKKQRIPINLLIFILIICIIVGTFTYKNLLSLVPVIIAMTYTIAATFKRPEKFKIVYGICGIIWLIYNYKVKAYVNIIGNIFEITSSFIGAKRKYKK